MRATHLEERKREHGQMWWMRIWQTKRFISRQWERENSNRKTDEGKYFQEKHPRMKLQHQEVTVKLKEAFHWSHWSSYLIGRFSWILAMSPMEGSERVYMVARMATTTKSQEEGLAG